VTRFADASAVVRLVVVVVAGAAAGAVCSVWCPWQLSTATAWNVAGITFASWVWSTVGGFDADQTREHATREDNSRVSAHVLLVLASVASLGGAAADLLKASQAHAAGKVLLSAMGVTTVIVSWTVVHTVFALRYAHEFYTPPVGGIDFKNDGIPPDYQDFAYVAFTLGMTFQVSDTDIQSRTIRRTALRHALLAYLFGAVILAVMVNVIANVIQ
jgi:uncharacterized membrane protein